MTFGTVGDRHPTSVKDHVVPVSGRIAAQGREWVGIDSERGRTCERQGGENERSIAP